MNRLVQFFALIALMLGALAGCSLVQPPILYVGDVRDVIAGVVNEDGHRWREASVARVGFGAGSPEGLESLGEFFLANGVAYAKSTDAASAFYYEVISGPRFVSTCSVFIPHGARPATEVVYTAPEGSAGMTLSDVYTLLHDAVGGVPFAFAGSADFSTFTALGVSRPPIHGEQLFDNRDKYYTEGVATLSDVPALVMGCAADFSSVGDAERRELLGRILYDNPFDAPGSLSVHSHALVLHREGATLDTVTPADVRDVNHLLSQSVLRSFSFAVYSMDSLAPLE